MRKTASLLAITLLTTPVVAQADEPTSGDPFKPVQPAWPSEWRDGKKAGAPSQAKPQSAPQTESARPSAQAEDNEVFTFDNESPPSEQSGDDSREEPAEDDGGEQSPEKEEPSAEAAPTAVSSSELETKPVSEVDLRTPHTLIAVGAAVVGIAAITGLALGIGLDKNDLAALSFAGGSLIGVGIVTTGVVLRNQGLEESGHPTPPSLPTGLALKVTLVR